MDGAGLIWIQFILATALARVARRVADTTTKDWVTFCYTDTHAGTGRLPRPSPELEAILANASTFTNQAFFKALEPPFAGQHPGSWVLAGRVIGAASKRLAVELDVNDIDHSVIAEARGHREGGWVRLWSHDWFEFLRTRLSGTGRRPGFVFIDPPRDDPRGPAYAIDAAILLDTLRVPYMMTYPVRPAGNLIDQIGHAGLELNGRAWGILLGGGGEDAVLDLLADLEKLVALMGCTFTPRLPREV